MEITTIGLDLAKNIFQVHGVDASGNVVVCKALRRSQVLPFFTRTPRCLVGIEACGTSHHWAREPGKLSRGPLLVSAAAAVSRGRTKGERIVDLTGDIARSEHKVLSLATRLRAGYLFEVGALHLTPLIELDAALVKDNGYRETGAGTFNLRVHSKTHFVADVRPALRLGSQFNLGGAVVRGYAEGGARIALNDLSHHVSLPDAPQDHDSVSLAMGRDRVVGTLATGLAIHAGERLEISGRYEAGFGKDTRSHTGGVKLGYKF